MEGCSVKVTRGFQRNSGRAGDLQFGLVRPRSQQGDFLSRGRDVDIKNLVIGLDFEKTSPARVRNGGNSRGKRLTQAPHGFQRMPSGILYFRLSGKYQFKGHDLLPVL
jgi:hypothetical protein